MILRQEYLQTLDRWRDKKVIKVITGIRRCGKSYLMNSFIDTLLKDGVSKKQIQHFNLEDLDNEKYLDYHNLYSNIKKNLLDGKMNYIFLDEVQLVKDFQRCVDSLFLLDNIDIYLTGSNAYLLSGEIATLLSGRYIEINMLPFSFKEYSLAFDSITKENLYRQYTEYTSFPYAVQLQDDLYQVREYLNGIYNTIVLKDIVSRKKINDVLLLESVIRFLADNVGNVTSVKRISDTLSSNGRKISSHTTESYIEALIESYVFYPVRRYDIKGLQFLKTGQKYYLTDVGLRNILLSQKTVDLGRMLENIVFLELYRRGLTVYVGKNDKQEIDFITLKGNNRAYYQVALSVRDENTLQRELLPLSEINDHYPKYLLTMDNDMVQNFDGIKKLYVLDWLMGKI
ncbi:MAG: ATP-binding protein [Bacteroidales bacterium]|nr:ATP-binding protein [Bacteroidales bacterium]